MWWGSVWTGYDACVNREAMFALSSMESFLKAPVLSVEDPRSGIDVWGGVEEVRSSEDVDKECWLVRCGNDVSGLSLVLLP